MSLEVPESLFLQKYSPSLGHFAMSSPVKFISLACARGVFLSHIIPELAFFSHWVLSEPVSKPHIIA